MSFPSNGILFNSISQFVEQVGRRMIWKYGELDNLISTWVGPAVGALAFKPKVNTPHPDFPLMFCTDSQITNNEALTAEVQATYQGIIQWNGKKPYITDPITSTSPVQGSRDFTILWVASHVTYIQGSNPNQPGTQSGYLYLNDVGTRSETIRYVGNQCSVKYQAYPRPGGLNYPGLGLSLVTWYPLTTFYGPVSMIAFGVDATYVGNLSREYPGTAPPIIAANLGFEIDQKGKWYDCTEIYGPTF